MSTSENNYKLLSTAPDGDILDRWNEFLEDAAFASHYVTPDFFDDPFAGEGERFAVLALSAGRVDAVLTGLRRGRSFTSGMAVRPQIAFRKGIDRSIAFDKLVDGITNLPGRRVEFVALHSWEPIGEGKSGAYEHQEATGEGRVAMLDLKKGAEELFKDFSERRRTDIRKTIKQDKLIVKPLETADELDEVYEVYRDWCGRKGKPVAGRDAFDFMKDSLYRKVFVAIFEGKVIAATYLRFCPGGIVEYAANNSLEGYQKLRANELLGWRAIEWACTAGFTQFSLGASHTFLARYGGTLIGSHRYCRDRTFLRVHNNRERITKLAIRAYLSLPDPLKQKLRSAASRI